MMTKLETRRLQFYLDLFLVFLEFDHEVIKEPTPPQNRHSRVFFGLRNATTVSTLPTSFIARLA